MSEPLVVAIMLVDGREAMTRRAVASFRAQSYERKRLLIWDTGKPAMVHPPEMFDGSVEAQCGEHATIGAMRNAAIECLMRCPPSWQPDIVCHFDSDDVSNEHRIAEQVALLQASGADATGYYEAPFWDTRPGAFCGAWLFRDPARKHVLGASMAFWRKTWQRHPFDDINHGEDTRFAGRCNAKAVSAITPQVISVDGSAWQTQTVDQGQPRIVCGIHGSNTSPGYDFTKRQQCFKRAPEFDEYCGRVMAL